MTLGDLYAQQYQPLRRMAFALARNPAATGAVGDAWAEDLVQETFLRAMGHLPRLSEMTEAHRTNWMRLTLKRLWIDHTRRQWRIASEDAADTPGKRRRNPWNQGDMDVQDDLTMVEVGQALSYLPEDQAQIVSLRYLAGFDSTRIGQLLGMPPATVRTKLRAAVTTLKRLHREGKL